MNSTPILLTIDIFAAVCTFIYAYFITKIVFKEKQAHLDHGNLVSL